MYHVLASFQSYLLFIGTGSVCFLTTVTAWPNEVEGFCLINWQLHISAVLAERYFNFFAGAKHFHNSNPMVWLITEVQARVPDDAGGTPDYMDPALI